MRKLWYVSGTLTSTAAALMRHQHTPWTLTIAVALAAGCASSGAAGGGAAATPEVSAAASAPVGAGAVHANLAGTRCHGATCTCRNHNDVAPEDPPPDEAHKRFEIRLGALDGSATLESPTLGQFTAGANDACFTIDVIPGTTHDVTFTAKEAQPESGVGPVLSIEEYGPKGPWWYDILEVRCAGPGGKCNRDAADAWGAVAKHRQRGRVDPCGSTVITHLLWDTSGGTGSRELGIFKDFSVTFTMEVKKFATQFKPGSTECVPK